MKKVAKLVMIDDTGKYLLMYRSEHPTYGIDPDLPGGTLEGDELPVDCMLREVAEESGVEIDRSLVAQLYMGTEYSESGTEYHLFVATLPARPVIHMSWEHSSFEWIDKDEFLEKSKSAKDTYMHMVHDALSKQS